MDVARTSRTTRTREQFLELLSECGNVRASCAAQGLQRSTVYAWRNIDAGFSAAWDRALELGADSLEDEAKKRALNGSDKLLIFLLRALKPEKYREKLALHINDRREFAYRAMSSNELRRQLAVLRQEQQDDPPAEVVAVA